MQNAVLHFLTPSEVGTTTKGGFRVLRQVFFYVCGQISSSQNHNHIKSDQVRLTKLYRFVVEIKTKAEFNYEFGYFGIFSLTPHMR